MNNFTVRSLLSFKSNVEPQKSHLGPSCTYELHMLPNTKVNVAKDHGEHCIEVRPPLVRHLESSRISVALHFWRFSVIVASCPTSNFTRDIFFQINAFKSHRHYGLQQIFTVMVAP